MAVAVEDAEAVLDDILDVLSAEKLRLTDLVCSTYYNPEFAATKREDLTPDGLQTILAKAGLDVELTDVENLVQVIAKDNRRSFIGVAELEKALSERRRRQAVGEGKNSPESRRQLSSESSTSCSDQERSSSTPPPVNSPEETIDAGTEDDLERPGATAEQLDRLAASRKLRVGNACNAEYNASCQAREERRRALNSKWALYESQRIEGSRSARSASPGPRSPENPSPQGVSERLHQEHQAREARRRQALALKEATEAAELDIVGAAASRRGGQAKDWHQALFADAQKRSKRLEKALLQKEEQERRDLGSPAATPGRRVNMTRLSDLHEEHRIRAQTRDADIAKQEERERKKIEEDIATHKQKCANAKIQVAPRVLEPPKREPPQRVCSVPTLPVGFNQSRPEPRKSSDVNLENVDHVLANINAEVSRRCPCAPSDGLEKTMQDLVRPMQKVLEHYRIAQVGSDHLGSGVKLFSGKRVFSGGLLIDDVDGFKQNCEPSPLKQLVDDLDTLLGAAAMAQNLLLSMIAFGHTPNSPGPANMNLRWPNGAKWKDSQLTRCCSFAYNPGPKTRAAARSKAWLRYAPSCGPDGYSHLTDLARVGLIFADSTALRAGLQDLISRLEVVDIRNYYQPAYANLLGDRYMEVLVVLSSEELPFPFICELRLEELGSFQAGLDSQSAIASVAREFAGIYGGAGELDQDALESLVWWALRRPKETHTLTVFRRQLSRAYGSTVAAWRKAIGSQRHVSFLKFREICTQLQSRERTVEFWTQLDCGRAGVISLFELDTEAVMLLATFYARLRGSADEADRDRPEVLFAQLTEFAQLQRPGEIMVPEFRQLLRPLGFCAKEADSLFSYLDADMGGRPPARITVKDFAWLLKLPALVDMDALVVPPAPEAEPEQPLEPLRAGSPRSASRRSASPRPASPRASASVRNIRDDALSRLRGDGPPLTHADSEPRRARSSPRALLGRHSRLGLMPPREIRAAFAKRSSAVVMTASPMAREQSCRFSLPPKTVRRECDFERLGLSSPKMVNAWQRPSVGAGSRDATAPAAVEGAAITGELSEAEPATERDARVCSVGSPAPACFATPLEVAAATAATASAPASRRPKAKTAAAAWAPLAGAAVAGARKPGAASEAFVSAGANSARSLGRSVPPPSAAAAPGSGGVLGRRSSRARLESGLTTRATVDKSMGCSPKSLNADCLQQQDEEAASEPEVW